MDNLIEYLSKNNLFNFFLNKKKFNFFLNAKRNYLKIVKEQKLNDVRKFYDQIIKVKSSDDDLNKFYVCFVINKLIQTKIFRTSFSYYLDKKKKFFFPLPKKFLLEIKKNFNVNCYLSSVAWFGVTLIFFFKFLISIINILKIKYFESIKLKNFIHKTTYNSFSILNNYPINNSGKIENLQDVNFGIFNWIKSKENHKNDYLIFSSKTIKEDIFFENYAYINNSFKLFILNTSVVKIFLYYLLITFNCLLNFLIFRFDYIVMSSEIFKSKITKTINNKKFNFMEIWANSTYQPLWIEKLENKENFSSIIIFNHLIEEIGSGNENSDQYDIGGFCRMNWKNFYVWNVQSKKYLERKFFEKKNIVVSNFFITNNNKFKNPIIDKNKRVSAFIYEDHKLAYGISPTADYMQYTKLKFGVNVEHQFLLDLIEMSNSFDFIVCLKRKRKMPKDLQFKKNENFIRKLNFNKNLYLIDPECSPVDLIQNTKINISLPFTSTGFLGKNFTINSIYYDPYNWVSANDTANAGVQTVKGKKKLQEWLSKHF